MDEADWRGEYGACGVDSPETDDAAQTGHVHHLLPVEATHRAVLAVDDDEIGPLIQVDGVQADHVVKAQLVRFQVDQVHNVRHQERIACRCTILLVVEVLEVEPTLTAIL